MFTLKNTPPFLKLLRCSRAVTTSSKMIKSILNFYTLTRAHHSFIEYFILIPTKEVIECVPLSEVKTTGELVKLLQDGNEKLFSLIAGLEESKMEVSEVQGFRSVKDILAHITHWNRHGIEWLKSVYKGETPVMPVKGDNTDDIRKGMAEINVEVHERNRDRPVWDVLGEYRETFALVIEQVKKLEEIHLDRVFDYPWAREPVSGRTVVM